MPKQPKPAATAPAVKKTEWTPAERAKLLHDAQTGKESALSETIRMMAAHKDIADLVYDISHKVREQIVTLAVGKDNILLQMVYVIKAEQMERDLCGPNPSQLERTLAERVATCWLAAECADMAAAGTGITLTKAEYLDKKAAIAHKRHLAAVESLAKVRRLQLPVQQINIATPGSQQMNVATPGAVELGTNERR